MSDTQNFSVRAELDWAKIFEQNRDKDGPAPSYPFREHGGAYTIEALMSQEDYDKGLETGSQQFKNAKKQDDGRWLVKNLRRKHEDKFTYGGPPQVRHADGETPWDLKTDGLIGNGSVGQVYLTVYSGKGLIGTRLEGVQILEHVVYESDESDTEYQAGPRFQDLSGDKPKEAKKPDPRPELEDNIPF